MKVSNASKTILEEVKRLLPKVEVTELQTLYPNYQFDVAQTKLVEADVIVWQLPVNWHSLPALLKNGQMLYLPLVLLMERTMSWRASFSTEAPEEAFQKDKRVILSLTSFTFIDKLLSLPKQSFLKKYIPVVMPEKAFLAVQQKAKRHVARLVALIKKIS